MRSIQASQSGKSEIASALASCKTAFVGVGLMSGVINVLYLTGSFFMLEVYDRVIPSGSIPSLIALCLLALLLFSLQGALDMVRSRILARIGSALDERLSSRVFGLVIRGPLRSGAKESGGGPLRDLDQIRGFLSSNGPVALFDLPWMPLYIVICFAFHPLIGVAACVGALSLIIITLLTEWLTRRPSATASRHFEVRTGLAEAGRRNAEALAAMGMAGRYAGLWSKANRDYMREQLRVADVAGGLGALSKVARMALQSGVLALGAYLVINGQATPGIIIASSILTSRALAPAELAIANWRGFVGARQSWHRLVELLNEMPSGPQPLPLAAPVGTVAVESISVCPPGSQRLSVHDITFELKAGQGLGIIGPSAAGKSSLVRALVGIWPTVRGKVRLDGADLDQWCKTGIGDHIGFLPQAVELFAGSVAENISRFAPDAPPELIVAAAKAAGIHELILALPQGYGTPVGDGGAGLSAGQRQRVGIARALYGEPFLVVLDEPNSNLDQEGDAALTKAILHVRSRGGIIVVVAHRPSALAGLDVALVLKNGVVAAFGPRDEVMAKLFRPSVVQGSSNADAPDGASNAHPRTEKAAGTGSLRVIQESA